MYFIEGTIYISSGIGRKLVSLGKLGLWPFSFGRRDFLNWWGVVLGRWVGVQLVVLGGLSLVSSLCGFQFTLGSVTRSRAAPPLDVGAFFPGFL